MSPAAVESVSSPLSQVSESQLAAIKRDLTEDLIRLLSGVGQPRDLAARDLFPADFSGTAIDGQFVNQVLGVADTFVNGTDADQTLSDTEAWGIYGIADLAAIPTLTHVRFGIGSAVTLAEFYLELAYATGEKGLIFAPPVIYRPAEIFNMDFLFSGATAADSEVIVVLGIVVEKAGTTISSRS